MSKGPKISALEKSAELINAGGAIKSKIKEAMQALGREYDKLREKNHDAQIAYANTQKSLDAYSPERGEFFRSNDLPFDLHQVRAEKHKAIFIRWSGEDVWKEVETLLDTREALKNLPVITKEAKEESVEEKVKKRVLTSFKSQIENNKANFNWAKAVLDEMNKELPEIKNMPVSINHVYCQNYHGTSWLRIDWFFSGKKVAFNVILAAVEAAKEEKKK